MSRLMTAANGLLWPVLLFVTAGCSPGEEPTMGGAPAKVPVILSTVEFQPEQVRLEAVGTSRALHSVTLFPETAGQVTAVLFKAGDRVKSGQALLRLDDRDERLAVKLAQVRLADAERLYQRYMKSDKNSGISPTTIDAAQAAMEAIRVELQRAGVALEDRTVKAPFDGILGITDIDPGDRIGPETPIAALDDRSELLVNFEVPEVLIDRVAVGDVMAVSAWNDSNRPMQGDIAAIDSRIDPLKRTFTVRARVANPDDRLRPGMSFRVRLELDGRMYPTVPEVSLQWGGEGSYIWIADDGKARRVPVTIVQRHEGQVLVDADLAVGAQVVIEGVQRMRDGVEITAWTNATIQPAMAGELQSSMP